MNVSNSRSTVRWKDIGEMAIGACVMGFPVATTEEVWNLGVELPLTRVLLFTLASLFFLGFTMYVTSHEKMNRANRREFLKRVFSTYGLTFTIAALLLFGLDRLEIIHSPLVALKRTMLVSFPASFAATVVDNLK
jgi:uncharacterized membrane protein